ncbi:MAG: isoprenylcysteine carboxylmethyltransferase family protein [Promethearchaeota archaeon]|nr:MAG: isoprenylcysteine carboxylmethyltransferase family protein [Candidatus Lokiarchaeota archaeon]
MSEAVIAWINFLLLNIFSVLFNYFYILSVQPVTLEESRGERAWTDCTRYRTISALLVFLMTLNLILWLWFPVPGLTWRIHDNFLIGILIALCIAIPCLIILYKAFKDAKGETMKPSKETTTYGGIYQYIRHPQTVGEFPIYIALAFAVNSLFLVLWTVLYILITVPIIKHYEENDLVKRFGGAYHKYQKTTGAFFPKIWKGTKSHEDRNSEK